VPRIRTTLGAAARPPRRPDPRARAGDRRQRIEARQRVEDRAGRRQHRVELAQHERALHVGAQRRQPGRLEHDGPRQPGQPERDRDAERAAEQRVGDAEAADPQAAAQAGAEQLQPAREHPADHQGTREREQRRVRRVRAVGQQQRADARAGDRAAHQPGERERADDEAAPQPGETQQHGQRDDDPVERRHRCRQHAGRGGRRRTAI
jgi:hypothetical protein